MYFPSSMPKMVALPIGGRNDVIGTVLCVIGQLYAYCSVTVYYDFGNWRAIENFTP
jgi:hypothetical protein